MDLNPTSGWEESTINNYLDVEWDNYIPQINGFAINVGYQRNLHPSSFTLRGYAMGSGSSDQLVTKTDFEYPNTGLNYFALPLNEKIYKKIRFQITKTESTRMRLNELYLLTCRYSVPEKLTLTKTELNLNAYVDTVSVGPTYDGFVSCTASPRLPSGLTLNYQTCTITGIAQEVVDADYKISALKPFASDATIHIKVTECTKTIVEISRTYGDARYMYETHLLRSADGTTVEYVGPNTVQKASTTTKTRYCVDGGIYELTLDSTVYNEWHQDSYISVGIVYESDVYNVLTWKYDINSGYNPSIAVNLNMEIKRDAEWYYSMGEIPTEWDSDIMPTGWQKAKKGSFPSSTTQLQFYKHKFTLENDPVGGGYELELRYTSGIIVVINGIEVYRNYVTGALTNETYASDTYGSTTYHRVTLPMTIPATNSSVRQDIIRKGDNVVAVAVVAQTASQVVSLFDASLRLMGRESVGRVFDFDATTTFNADPKAVFDLSSQTAFSTTSCSGDNSIHITFKNDRREWISKYSILSSYSEEKNTPKSWVFQAKNPKDTEWVTLDTVESTEYWNTLQLKSVYVNNLLPYNMYRLTNIQGSDSTKPCEMEIFQIGLYASSLAGEQPELEFSGNPVGYLNVDFEDLVPTCAYYKHFTVTPALPSFLTMDPLSGVIRGKHLSLLEPTAYNVTAQKLDGTAISKELTLSVIVCDKSMVELAIRTDTWPDEMGWKLFKGTSASGDPLKQVLKMDGKNAYDYTYFCLDNGIFTFQFTDSRSDGWNSPAGYRVLNPNGAIYAVGSFPRGIESKTETFSNTMVLAQGDASWRILRSAAPSGWTSISFNDESWTQTTAGDVGKFESRVVYLRHSFELKDITTLPVMNVRLTFAGGIAAYLNGNRVYRVNLPKDINFDTTATDEHTYYRWSSFSIPLQVRGAQVGMNVLALEVHRAPAQAADVDVSFNLMAVQSYGECAPIENSVPTYEVSPTVAGSGSSLFDGTVWNYVSWDWVDGTYASWKFENLEGVQFNKYFLYYESADQLTANTATWAISALRDGEEVGTTFDERRSEELKDRYASGFSTPNGVIGYSSFRIDFQNVAEPSGFSIDEIRFAYCPPKGRLCPAVGNYPSVGAGEISVSTCPEFYDGYSYRECDGTQLGEVKLDRCKKYAPKKLTYEESLYTVYVNANIKEIKPTVFGLVDDFQIDPLLPDGLVFNEKTGVVSGKPLKASTRVRSYTVTGYNEKGSVSGNFTLAIITGFCDADELWPRTEIGTTYTYDCKEQGNYFGTMKRTCKLGKNEPEWGTPVGFCMAMVSFVAMGVLLVLVIIVIALVLVKVSADKKKARARSGVKGGKKALNIMKSVPYAKI